MTRSRRLLITLIAYVPVLILIVFTAFYVTDQYRRVLENADDIVRDELTRRFNKEVRVGRAFVTPLGTVILEDVEVANGRTFASGTLITAERVIISYNLRALLYGRGAQGVGRVELINPRAQLVRRRDGTLNIVDLFKAPPGPRRPAFKGVVAITGGQATFMDYRANTRPLPAIIRFSNLDAIIDAVNYPAYSFRVSTTGEKDKFRSIKAVGVYNPRKGTINLDVDGKGVSAAYSTAYFGVLRSMRVIEGELRVLAGLNIRRNGRWTVRSVTGTARVAGASVRMPGLLEPIKQIDGNIVLGGQQVAMNLGASLADARWRVVGTVSGFQNPKLGLAVTSPNANFSRLTQVVNLPGAVEQLQLSGRGPIRAIATGTIANPIVEATARIPAATALGYAARNVAVSASYDGKVIAFRSLQFQALGASIAARGSVNIGAVPSVSIQARINNLRLSQLPIPAGVQVSGIADADLRISGTLANPVITANVNATNGSFNNIPFGSAFANVRYTGGRVQIDRLVALRVDGGSVRISGTITASSANLNVVAEGINLAAIGKAIGQPGYEGIGFFRGQISGSLAQPSITGVLEVFRGRYQGYQAEYLRVDIAGGRQEITVIEGVARLFGTEVEFTGRVSGFGTAQIGVQGRARLGRMTAEQLMNLLGRKFDITGIISGELEISGTYRPGTRAPFRDIKASGALRIEDATAFGYLISNAVINLKLANNQLVITEASITSQDAQLVAAGSIALDTNTVNIDFSLGNFNLAKITNLARSYAQVSGIVGANGTITGTLIAPNINARVAVANLTINNKRFDTAVLTFAYADNAISSFLVELKRGIQQIDIQGADYNLETNCVASTSGRLVDISVRELWEIFMSSPYLATENGSKLRESLANVPRVTSGFLNGTFQVSGCMTNPDGALNLQATNVGIDTQQIESINVDASVVNGVVTLNQVRAVSEEMVLSATGAPLYRDGELQLEVTAQNMDLSRLRPWLGDNNIGGVLAAEFTIQGNVSSPQVTGSVEVVNPSFRGLVFDRLRMSRIDVTSNKIEFSDVILASGNHQVIAQGFLPWNWASLSIPQNQPLELSARLNRQDLSVLGAFTTAIDTARTSGEVEAVLNITGTLASPQLNGLLAVENGTVGITGLTNDFRNVVVNVSFDGDRIVFNQVSAESSLGGAVSIQPGSYISVGNLTTGEANMLVAANQLVIAERNALGFQEDVRMQIDAGISVTGNLNNLQIADANVPDLPGGVVISNARLSFVTPQGLVTRQPPVLLINPRLNITLRLGEDVLISPPNMSLLVSGGGLLTGTAASPNLVLNLAIEEGSMRLATSRLRIVPGGRITARYSPDLAAPELLVEFQATTTVTATSPFGRRERYVITLGVRGPVNNLQIKLSSTPSDLSREQILAALGHVEGIFATGEAGLQRELGNILTAVGTSTLFAPIETLFVERLGFEQFTLEFNPTAPLVLYASRKLAGNFYVSFYRRLTSDFTSVDPIEYQLNLSYRFRSLYEVSIGVDDQANGIIQAQYTNRFW